MLTVSKLSEDHVWWGFFVAAGLFLLVFLVVTGLVIWIPKNLLFGKEELSNPALEPSALRDAIEDIIAAGYAPADVERVTRLIKINEYKRRQAPIGIRVTHRSFGKDWRYPITSKFRA